MSRTAKDIEDFFQINDIVLKVAPTQINITNQAANYEWQTLRTKHPQRTKSGHSVLNVSLNIVWVGEEAINQTLRPLIAQLRLTPFCYIENAHLRNNLFPNEGSVTGSLKDGTGDEPIILIFRSAVLEVDPSTAPVTVQGVIEFSYFSYKPYCAYFQYKQELGQILTPAGVTGTAVTPDKSEPWKLYYQGALANTEPIAGQFNGDATLHFLEFRTTPTDNAPELEAQLRILENLGGSQPELFLESFGRHIGSDIAVSILQAGRDTGVLGPADAVGQAENIISLLRESSPRFQQQRYNREHAITDSGRNQPFEDLVDREQLINAIEMVRRRVNTAGTFAQEQDRLEGPDKFEKVPELSTNRGTDISVWKRLRRVDLKRSEDIIIVNIRVAFRNVVAPLPVVGHRYATFQHLGSMDAVVDLDMMVTSETANRRLAWCYSTIEDTMLKHKKIPQGLQAIQANCDFLRLFGLNDFLTQDYSADTVPGEPGTYAVTLRLVESGVGPDDRLDAEDLKPEFISSDPQLRSAIMKAVLPYTRFSSGKLEFSARGLDPVRQQAFTQQIKGILPAYNRFLEGITDYLEDTGRTTAFFLATEDDIPGITLIQDVVAQRRGPEELDQSLKFSTLDRSVIEDLRRQGLGNARRARSRLAMDVEATSTERARMSPTALREREARNRNLLTFGGAIYKDQVLDIQKWGVDADRLDTIEGLKQSQPVQRWFRDINQFTGVIINTNKIAIPEFSEAFAMLSKVELRSGRPAYPDLLLKPVADQLGVEERVLDPDFYLLSPIIDNVASVIDPMLITQAKAVALESYHSAKQGVDSYFNKWLGFFDPGLAQQMIRAAHSDSVQERQSKKQTRPGSSTAAGARTQYRGMEVDESDTWSNGIHRAATVASPKKAPAPIEVGSRGGEKTIGKDSKVYMADMSPVTWHPASTITHSADPNALFEGVPATIQGISIGGVPAASTRSAHQGGPSSSQPASDIPEFAGGDQLFQPLSQLVVISHKGEMRNFDAQGRGIPGLREHRGIDLKASAGTQVFAVADGEVLRAGPSTKGGKADGAGWRVVIQHRGNTQSKYFHLSEGNIRVVAGQRVKGGELIALSGATSNRPISPHLHLEMWSGSDPLDPEKYFTMTSARGPRERGAFLGPGTGASGHISVLQRSIEEFEKSLKTGQAMRMVRAFPTFKLYFIEDDSEDRKRFGLDDFFSYNSVKSIRVVRSRKIAADLMVVELTNVSGNLMNRKFKYEDPNAAERTDTLQENPLESIAIQEGIDVELRLGYSSDPEKLTSVFVGKIMEVEFNDTEDLITITCQSHAIELVQDVKGLSKPDIRDGWFVSDARTHVLLEHQMAEPELVHFGRWERSREVDFNTQTFRHTLQNKFRLTPTPQDDNIFAPDSRRLDDGWIFDDLEYAIYQKTTWDIFQEMTLRHPGWIASAVPYKDKFGPRMTMFFGLPAQLYFARDPTALELSRQHQIGEEVRQDATESVVEALADPSSDLYSLTYGPSGVHPTLGSPITREVQEIRNVARTPDSEIRVAKMIQDAARRSPVIHAAMLRAQRSMIRRREEGLARDANIIRPFRNYHLLTSGHHILYNSIGATSNSYNTVTVQFGEHEFDEEISQFVADDDLETFTLKVDAGLPDEEIRELFAPDYINCNTKLLARRYAQALLAQSLKDIYKGELVVIGNPDIKPGDLCYLFDEYSDVSGPIEVEQVTHVFSKEAGFITEIVPDLFVTANEWTNMTLADAMGIFMEGSLKSVYENTSIGAGDLTVKTLKGLGVAGTGALLGAAPISFAIIGASAFGAGIFMRRKVLDFSNHCQPVFMHPLTHNGRPMLAGLPMRKLDNTWTTRLGQWVKDGAEGWSILLEDFYDKLTLAPTQGKLSNIFSGTDVPPKF